MKALLAAAFFCLAAVAPAWADPSGTYKVSGTNLDGTTKYEGSVVLTQTGYVAAGYGAPFFSACVRRRSAA